MRLGFSSECSKMQRGSIARPAIFPGPSVQHHKVSNLSLRRDSRWAKNLRDHSSAHALGLFVTENESKKKDYAALIQKFNRWLTNTVALEDASAASRTRPARNGSGRSTPKPESNQTTALVNQILALTGQTENVCAMCGHTVSKDFAAHVVDLVYPRKVRYVLPPLLCRTTLTLSA